jgi:hypothetical protein
MRVLILVALLFTFTVGTFSDIAHAATPDHTCAHQQIDQDNGSESCHSNQDPSQCDDCCCVHSHTIAMNVSVSSATPIVSGQSMAVFQDSADSDLIYGLRRPPRL